MNKTITKIIKIAGGNPGALSVAQQIAEKDTISFEKLYMMTLLKNPKSYMLWVVYKDICKEDINKTIQYLNGWHSNATATLKEHISTNNPEINISFDDE